MEFTDQKTGCLNRFAADFDFSPVACIALIFPLISAFCFSDTICLKRFTFDLEFPVFVCYGQIAFMSPVMIVFLQNIFKAGIRKKHFSQFIFRYVSQHQTAHTWVYGNDFSKFPFRDAPFL